MNKFDLLQLARRNLWRRKVRTILTTLGVLIGTTSIVVMLSLGIGLNENQRQSMERWGSLTIIRVQQGMVFDNEGKPLREGKTLDDDAVAELKALEGVMAVSPVYDAGGEAQYGRKRGGLQLIGIDPEAMGNLEFEAAEGRLLEPGDRNVMVVGNEVINQFRDEAFLRRMERGMMPMGPMMEQEVQDPTEMLDQRISMVVHNNSNYEKKKLFGFTVVGILEGDRNEHSYQAYAPIDEIKRMRRFMMEGSQNAGRVQSGMKTAVISRNGQRVVSMAGGSARSSRGSTGNSYDDYSYILVRTADVGVTKTVSQAIKDAGYNSWSMADNLEGIEKSSRTIQAVLGGIGSITLLVAALGITNTMIMSIYERTREIGIMKVIGASYYDIHTMFLAEAGLIGFMGGILGLGLSYSVSAVINHLSQGFMNRGMPPGEETIGISLIPPWLALFAVLFAVLIGVLAGLYPANRAVRLSPITAIRND